MIPVYYKQQNQKISNLKKMLFVTWIVSYILNFLVVLVLSYLVIKQSKQVTKLNKELFYNLEKIGELEYECQMR